MSATTGQEARGAQARRAVGRELAWLLRSTEQRPQTEAELAAKLARRGVDADVAAAVLQRARQLRAVDDAAFARMWVEDRGHVRGYGAARLRQELRRRLVPQPLIDDALALLAGRDDEAVATDLARQRLQRLPDRLAPEAVARRLEGFLVRRGYAPGLAQRVAIAVSGVDRLWD